MVNSEKNAQIIKNIINSMEKNPGRSTSVSENDIREKIKTIDKNEVMKKLRSMGLGNVARMLENMSDDDIIREISGNPGILKKLNTILKGGNM